MSKDRIVRLEAENVKKLRAVEIKPDGNLVVIGGKNGQGKSSVLDSIEMALGGTRSVPPQPIHEGEKRARVVCETEELVVTRVFTAKGSRLEVKGKDGVTLSSPQSVLDSLVGDLSFDPLSFARMSGREQLERLKELTGLDFTDADEERERLYQLRRDTNWDLKNVGVQRDAVAEEIKDLDIPDELVNTKKLLQELEDREYANEQNHAARKRLDGLREAHESAKEEVDRLKRELEMARERRVALAERIEKGEKVVGDLQDLDTDEVREQIAEAGETNELVKKKRELKRLDEQQESLKKVSDDYTKQLRQIDVQKAKALAETNLPVDGLEFGDDGVTYQGLPFEQAADSERLRVSLAMGLAVNPDLPVILIRDGSLLDPDSLKVVADLAREQDAQVWVERVSTGDEVSVVIEDGEVRE